MRAPERRRARRRHRPDRRASGAKAALRAARSAHRLEAVHVLRRHGGDERHRAEVGVADARRQARSSARRCARAGPTAWRAAPVAGRSRGQHLRSHEAASMEGMARRRRSSARRVDDRGRPCPRLRARQARRAGEAASSRPTVSTRCGGSRLVWPRSRERRGRRRTCAIAREMSRRRSPAGARRAPWRRRCTAGAERRAIAQASGASRSPASSGASGMRHRRGAGTARGCGRHAANSMVACASVARSNSGCSR